MTNVAIIPARGGSKRIPRKNIRPFLGRPMIAWSIAAAQQAGVFDRIIVSTDDAEIAEVAQHAGAEVPFVRDPKLADDHTGVADVMQDAIRRLSTDSGFVCLLYATAPLVQAADMTAGLRALTDQRAEFAISVTAFPAPIQRALRIDNGLVRMMDEAQLLVRSQDLMPAYHDAGQFCWGSARAWSDKRRVFIAPTAAIEIPSFRVQDIDTFEDWDRAEVIARALRLGEEG